MHPERVGAEVAPRTGGAEEGHNIHDGERNAELVVLRRRQSGRGAGEVSPLADEWGGGVERGISGREDWEAGAQCAVKGWVCLGMPSSHFVREEEGRGNATYEQ